MYEPFGKSNHLNVFNKNICSYIFKHVCVFLENPKLVPVKIAFAMVGKFGITASYGIIYLLAAELFPTVTRYVYV